MPHTVQTAADMPAGTEADCGLTRWTKTRPGNDRPWTDNLGKTYTDDDIDLMLRVGALIGHVPSGPGHWPTQYMPAGTLIEYDGERVTKVRETHREPFGWASEWGAWYDDEWAARAVTDGATVTYPQGR